MENNKTNVLDLTKVKNNTPKKKKPRKKPVKKEQNVKVYSLGGLGVIGMNMYVVEVDNEIIVIDAGVVFADDDVHGVNYIIPDFTHLIKNEKRIVALFITHVYCIITQNK